MRARLAFGLSGAILAVVAWAWLRGAGTARDESAGPTTQNRNGEALDPSPGAIVQAPPSDATDRANQPWPEPAGRDEWKPESVTELLAGHLGPAPPRLRRMARDLFLQQAEHFAAKARAANATSLSEVLAELDDRYAERLRRAAVARLEQGHGLLVVAGGSDYMKRVGGKPFLMWGGSETLHDRSFQVLVVLDESDHDLDAIATEHRNVRGALVAEKLIVFNAKPVEERARTIQAYLKARAEKPVAEPWFGVETNLLEHVRIDQSQWLVLPRDL